MPSEKATFYARDTAAVSSDTSKGDKKTYMGEERRRRNRRTRADRRNEVRFDLKGGERRELQGRREKDHSPKFW